MKQMVTEFVILKSFDIGYSGLDLYQICQNKTLILISEFSFSDTVNL